MGDEVRKITELQVRREVEGHDRPGLICDLQLRGFQEAETVDPRSFKDWEDRQHDPSAAYRKMLCARFEVPSVAWLGLGDSWEAAFHWTYINPKELTQEVNRRKSLHIMGAAGATAAAGLLLPAPRLVALAQMMDGAHRIGAGDVVTARQTATDIAAAYVATPNGVARRAARAHALTLLGLLKRASMSDDTRTGLTAVASDAASLAGHGQLDAGRLHEAHAWFTDALKLARQARDRRLEAYALASFAAIPMGAPEADHAAAVAALEPAAEFQRFLPPVGRAFVFGNLGLERAALGDDLASGRFLERARAAAARIPYAGSGWGWWSVQGELDGWNGVRLEVFTGHRSLRLERPAEALDLFDGALDGTTAPVRRAHLHEDLTHTCVALGDPDRACASAHAVLDEAGAHGLGKFPPILREARKSFPKEWRLLAPVAALDERLALAS
ncbi:MAG: hypothetical protein ACRD0K_04270 [Egibacteraceae bacterium]